MTRQLSHVLDQLVTVIVTEKPNVSKSICAALLPVGERPELFSCLDVFLPAAEGDIIESRFILEPYHFVDKSVRRISSFESQVVFGEELKRRILRRRSGFDEARSERRSGKQKSEQIRIYAVRREDRLVVIVDTNGNPLTLRGTTNSVVSSLVNGDSKDKVLDTLRLSVGADDKKDVAPYMRMKLLADLIAHERLPFPIENYPCGTRLTIDSIVNALDSDIAGQYIFSTVIAFADQVRRGLGREPITQERLRRLNVKLPLREAVESVLSSPATLSAGPALAGKARAIFDRVFDYVLNGEMRRHERRINFTLGRVRWLALRTFIEAWRAQSESSSQPFCYLYFSGNIDRLEIERRIKVKEYALAHCTLLNSRLTVSRLMELNRDRRIGTHTTRFKIHNGLVDAGLVRLDGLRLIPTPLGLDVYDRLRDIIDAPDRPSVSSLSRGLTDAMDQIEKCSDQADAQALFDEYIDVMLHDMRSYLHLLRGSELLDRVASLSVSYTMTRKRELGEDRRRSQHVGNGLAEGHSENQFRLEPDGKLTLFGSSAMVPAEIIREYRSNSSQLVTLERVEADPPKDSKIGDIRRVYRIRANYGFQFFDIFAPSRRVTNDDAECVVFRAPIEFANLLMIVGLDGSFPGTLCKDWKPCNVDLEEMLIDGAHGPLYASAMRRSDLNSTEKRMIAREYLLPWRLNDEIVNQNRSGNLSVSEFVISTGSGEDKIDLRFERVEWTAIGKVHNFESMLSLMEGKYSMPVETTSSIMEDLYLGS